MIEQLSQFMNAGGIVLYAIAALTFLMWTLIFERFYYYFTDLKKDISSACERWEARTERQSWQAKKIRLLLLSQVKLSIHCHMPMIRTMVALCPLLGLFGTVWGMIEVFNIMAVTGGGEAKAMAGGVSKATIPTMAGMVAALSGVFANTFLTRIAERESLLLDDHLTLDH